MKYLFWILMSVHALTVAQDFKNYTQSIAGSAAKFEMVAVPAGKFEMGSKSMMADNDESPVKEIEVSAFWMGAKEVTFAEWDG